VHINGRYYKTLRSERWKLGEHIAVGSDNGKTKKRYRQGGGVGGDR
jgi:hypothetical protein